MTYSTHQAIRADLQNAYSFDVRVGSSLTIAAPSKPPLSCSKDNLSERREQLRLTVVLSEDALKVAKFAENQLRQDIDSEKLEDFTDRARDMWQADSRGGREQLRHLEGLYEWEDLNAFLTTTKSDARDRQSHDRNSLFISMEPWLPCQMIRWVQAANCEEALSSECEPLFDNVYLAIPQ